MFCRFVDVNMWLIFKTGQMALAALQHNNTEVKAAFVLVTYNSSLRHLNHKIFD